MKKLLDLIDTKYECSMEERENLYPWPSCDFKLFNIDKNYPKGYLINDQLPNKIYNSNSVISFSDRFWTEYKVLPLPSREGQEGEMFDGFTQVNCVVKLEGLISPSAWFHQLLKLDFVASHVEDAGLLSTLEKTDLTTIPVVMRVSAREDRLDQWLDQDPLVPFFHQELFNGKIDQIKKALLGLSVGDKITQAVQILSQSNQKKQLSNLGVTPLLGNLVPDVFTYLLSRGVVQLKFPYEVTSENRLAAVIFFSIFMPPYMVANFEELASLFAPISTAYWFAGTSKYATRMPIGSNIFDWPDITMQSLSSGVYRAGTYIPIYDNDASRAARINALHTLIRDKTDVKILPTLVALGELAKGFCKIVADWIAAVGGTGFPRMLDDRIDSANIQFIRNEAIVISSDYGVGGIECLPSYPTPSLVPIFYKPQYIWARFISGCQEAAKFLIKYGLYKQSEVRQKVELSSFTFRRLNEIKPYLRWANEFLVGIIVPGIDRAFQRVKLTSYDKDIVIDWADIDPEIFMDQSRVSVHWLSDLVAEHLIRGNACTPSGLPAACWILFALILREEMVALDRSIFASRLVAPMMLGPMGVGCGGLFSALLQSTGSQIALIGHPFSTLKLPVNWLSFEVGRIPTLYISIGKLSYTRFTHNPPYLTGTHFQRIFPSYEGEIMYVQEDPLLKVSGWCVFFDGQYIKLTALMLSRFFDFVLEGRVCVRGVDRDGYLQDEFGVWTVREDDDGYDEDEDNEVDNLMGLEFFRDAENGTPVTNTRFRLVGRQLLRSSPPVGVSIYSEDSAKYNDLINGDSILIKGDLSITNYDNKFIYDPTLKPTITSIKGIYNSPFRTKLASNYHQNLSVTQKETIGSLRDDRANVCGSYPMVRRFILFKSIAVVDLGK